MKIGSSLRAVFVILGERLSGDYGGTIEHLWIHILLKFNLQRARSFKNQGEKVGWI